MTNKAKKKAIEVWATRYDSTVDISQLLKFIKDNSSEPVFFDSKSKSIIIQKARGDIELKLNNWLIWEINTDKKFWAIDEEIFFKTYQRKYREDHHSFTKKQIEIEYCHFKNTDNLTIKSLLRFMNIKPNTVLEILQEDELISDIKVSQVIPVNTLEGRENLNLGEYLIKGINGELYPVSSKSFNQVYDTMDISKAMID